MTGWLRDWYNSDGVMERPFKIYDPELGQGYPDRAQMIGSVENLEDMARFFSIIQCRLHAWKPNLCPKKLPMGEWDDPEVLMLQRYQYTHYMLQNYTTPAPYSVDAEGHPLFVWQGAGTNSLTHWLSDLPQDRQKVDRYLRLRLFDEAEFPTPEDHMAFIQGLNPSQDTDKT